MKLRTTLTTLAVAALLAAGLALPAQADTVAPVRRVSCPSVAAVKAASGVPVTTMAATPETCTYYAGGTATVLFELTDYATPAEAQADIAANWPEEAPYPFDPRPVPSLGPGAFRWADASPSFVYWQFAPGVTAELFGVWSDAAVVNTPPLFRPMMEVYTVPGTRTVNGRQWRTSCEPYSATARCRTEIWATVVLLEGGRYVKTDGWAFNSLTYRWSDRALWKGNPLGNTNAGWVADGEDGRRWRTECDTAATGRGACRSYILATVISATPSRYVQEAKWVFNNQVLFSN
ncbi:hypothetical protein GCM10025789_10380 [Tessaracoccus lubricantis]|uniref:DUF3558 domain-containing protein n=1 Tax=Tessaracoccus lubricantis TaxID=545543 RepID=A0ABP9F7S9_9ACTN